MIEAQLPDGTTLQFPDGTADDVIDRAVQQQIGSGSRPPATPASLLGRLGMGARDALVGVAAVPGMAYDLAGTGINAVTGGIEALGGPSIPRVRRASENLEDVADAAGLPRPQTREEQRVSATSRGVAGVVPTLAAGGLPGLPPAMATLLAGSPVSQVVGGASGGLAGELAAENGAGPWGQFGASILGGLGGAAVTQAAAAGGRLAASAAQPFSEAGRRRIVGEVLQRSSADPAGLAGRIATGVADTDRRLPGSPVTTAQASRDPGLAILESGARSQAAPTGAGGMSPAVTLRNVDAERNASRVGAIEGMADGGTPEGRGAVVRGALRDADAAMGARVDVAFDRARQNGGRFSIAPVLEEAEGALRSYQPANGGAGVPAELRGVVDDL
ncbi:MAG TPA: hypothetical protein VGM87_05575, partial [Roseomonas sp.]